MTKSPTPAWWRDAAVYQIYPRSFADSDGDGLGDLRGIIDRLGYLVDLGVDAVWISPWYPSPMADAGYDVSDYRDIDPRFGTLADADELIARAHALGLRVIIDLVPNHCSAEHPWFREALAAAPGSPERERFVFRDGHGEQPPTNWVSVFGGPAWQRTPDGQWYLHAFAPEQPDWNWENPEVVAEFDAILRFWFDRGVDGFRVDVADSMALDQSLPNNPIDERTGVATLDKFPGAPQWDQPGLVEIQQRWRAIADSYAASPQGPRVFISEAYLALDRLVAYVGPGRLHTTFNFDALQCEWEPTSLRHVIDRTLAAHDRVGAPCTWVLSNHDTVRVATRYGKHPTGVRYTADGIDPATELEFHGLIGTPTELATGYRRARAAALLMLALPGGVYVYQGEELGLEEVEDLPDRLRQDPTWERSGHTNKGRDGARVPLPWSCEGPSLGFGPGPGWLPQPAHWSAMSVAAQADEPMSTLSLYRSALRTRRRNPALGAGTMTWLDDLPDGVLGLRREPGFRCLVNLSGQPIDLPRGRVLLASARVYEGKLGNDAAVWLTD